MLIKTILLEFESLVDFNSSLRKREKINSISNEGLTKAKNHQDHYTLGLDVCTSFLFLNRKNMETYMNHFYDLSDKEMMNMFCCVTNDWNTEKKNIELYVHGNSIEPYYSKDSQEFKDIITERKRIETMVNLEFNNENIFLDWAGKGLITSIYLDKQLMKLYKSEKRSFPEKYYK